MLTFLFLNKVVLFKRKKDQFLQYVMKCGTWNFTSGRPVLLGHITQITHITNDNLQEGYHFLNVFLFGVTAFKYGASEELCSEVTYALVIWHV